MDQPFRIFDPVGKALVVSSSMRESRQLMFIHTLIEE